MSAPQAPPPHGSILREIDLPLFAALSLHTVFVYLVVVIARVTASYAMLDLGLSFVWVGVISSAFSLIPILAMIGGGIDMGRGYLSQSRLQQACDAGVLAGRLLRRAFPNE